MREGKNYKNKQKRPLSKYPLIPAVTIFVAAIIIVTVLLTPPYLGMEDNGDYARITYSQGLYDLPENEAIRFDGYFIKEYGIMQYYNEYESTVFTSQGLFIQPAIWIDNIITGNDNIFDLRFLGFIMSIYFLIVLYFLVDYLSNKLSILSQILIAAVCLFVFLDTGYTAYFNSFFAESVAYISLMGCITCALLFAEGRFNKYIVLAGFVINGMILTFSKQQFAPVGVVLGMVCLFFYLKENTRLSKYLIAISSALLVFSGIATYLLIPKSFTNINLYHSMTRGIMMTSDNPPKTLATFDIEPEYELLNQTIYFDRYPVIHPEDERIHEDFYSKYSIMSVVKHYIANPDAFVEMLKIAAKNAYMIRPDLGNFERSTGRLPNEKAQTFSLYSRIKANYTPKTAGYVIIWIAAAFALLFNKRLKQIIIIGLILIGLSQIVVPIIGAGDADLAKHMFLYNASYDIANVILAAHVIAFFDAKYKKKKQIVSGDATVSNQVQ